MKYRTYRREHCSITSQTVRGELKIKSADSSDGFSFVSVIVCCAPKSAVILTEDRDAQETTLNPGDSFVAQKNRGEDDFEIIIKSEECTVIKIFHDGSLKEEKDSPAMMDYYRQMVAPAFEPGSAIKLKDLLANACKPAAKDDFRIAFGMYFRSFRVSVRRREKFPLWEDDLLFACAQKMESAYITLICWLLGLIVMAVAVAGVAGTSGFGIFLAAAVIWSALDLLVINPFIYMKAMPRPIRNHLIKKSEMTQAQKESDSLRKKKNKRTDRILRKYESTGRTQK